MQASSPHAGFINTARLAGTAGSMQLCSEVALYLDMASMVFASAL